MKMPGKFGGGNYRYAYQGQEKDDETGFEAFELRQWDGRIGRWMSTDPYGQYASPYLGMGNNPVNKVDPDGGFDNPVYGSNGEGLLGTTESGFTGEALIMDATYFNQGMSDLVAFNVGMTLSQFYFQNPDGLTISGTGLAFGVADELLGNSTFRMFNKNGTNFSPKLYSGWKGGSVGNIKTFNTSTILKGAGKTIGYIGILNSGVEVFTGKRHPVGGAIDAIMGVIGIYGSTPGMIGSFTYEAGKKVGPSTWYGNDNYSWFK